MELWRDNGKTFDVESLNIKPSERGVLLKLRETMLECRRSNASNLSPVEAEQIVKAIINGMNWWEKKARNTISSRKDWRLSPQYCVTGW